MGVIVASFGGTSAWAGRQVDYDNGIFSVDGAAFSLADLLSADQQGLIVWAHDGMKEWASGLPLGAAAQGQPVTPRPAPQPHGDLFKRMTKTRTRKIMVGAVGALVILTAIGAIGSASGPSHKTARPVAGPVAVTAPSPTTKSASPTTSPNQQGAANFVRAAGTDTRRVQVSVQFVQVALGIAVKTQRQADVDQLAQTAQQAHDNIGAIRDDFATTVTSRAGALQDAENMSFTAANDLKNAMGAMVAYAGTPNAATLAHFTSQYGTARAEWNDSVRTIWHLAHEKNPPTV